MAYQGPGQPDGHIRKQRAESKKLRSRRNAGPLGRTGQWDPVDLRRRAPSIKWFHADSGRSSAPRGMFHSVVPRGSRHLISAECSACTRSRYVRVIGVLVVLGQWPGWPQKQSELNETRDLAESVFYRMKSFELTLSQLEDISGHHGIRPYRRTEGGAAAVAAMNTTSSSASLVYMTAWMRPPSDLQDHTRILWGVRTLDAIRFFRMRCGSTWTIGSRPTGCRRH